MTPRQVVVVGGGIIGLTVGWRAASAGAQVTVCDPAPGRGSSWAAAGMLAPIGEASAAEAPLTRLGLESVRRWPAFADELSADAGCTPEDLGFRREGTLQVAFDDDDRRVLEELAAVHRLLGLESEVCSSRRCREIEPLLAPSVRGGLFVAGDWQVDPRRVVGALERALSRRGGRLVTSAVQRLRTTGEEGARSVEGVELEDGSGLDAATVVLASGARAALLEGLPEEAVPPVRPVKGEILRLGATASGLRPSLTVRAHVRGQFVYVVPRTDGEVVVGATMQEAGFDTGVRAGAVLDLLRAAIDLLPALSELSVSECLAASRPGTPDNGPVLGPTPVDGLLLATGHHRNGVLLAPVTGDALVGALSGGGLPREAASFTLGRFT